MARKGRFFDNLRQIQTDDNTGTLATGPPLAYQVALRRSVGEGPGVSAVSARLPAQRLVPIYEKVSLVQLGNLGAGQPLPANK